MIFVKLMKGDVQKVLRITLNKVKFSVFFLTTAVVFIAAFPFRNALVDIYTLWSKFVHSFTMRMLLFRLLSNYVYNYMYHERKIRMIVRAICAVCILTLRCVTR